MILSGSSDKTLQLFRRIVTPKQQTLAEIPVIVQNDISAFVEDQKVTSPISQSTMKILGNWCEPGDSRPSLRVAGLHLIVEQFDSNFMENDKKLSATIVAYKQKKLEVAQLKEKVKVLCVQLHEAEEALMQGQQQLQILLTEKKKCVSKDDQPTKKSLELGKARDFFKLELEKSRAVIIPLLSKLKEHTISTLTQDDVDMLLQELSFPLKLRACFKDNQIDGSALGLLKDENLRDLGITDINLRKTLLHALEHIRVHGTIFFAPLPGSTGVSVAASWNSGQVFKWLEEQGFAIPALKGLTGQILLHLGASDLTSLGLPLGPALKLADKCQSLKREYFSVMGIFCSCGFLIF